MAEVGFLLRVCLNDFPVLIFFFQLPDVQKSTELVSEFLSEGIALDLALYSVCSLEERSSGDSHVTILSHDHPSFLFL